MNTADVCVCVDGDQIYAPQFDDIYFSRENGLAESNYVFLEGNQLPERWQNTTHFSIVETGFGTGLNFLAAIAAWIKDTKHCETLHYYSIEKFPIDLATLKDIYKLWPEFQEITHALVDQYPSMTSGCHSLIFEGGRVQLHLIFEDVSTALETVSFKPDCWFLDGFAPSKNPQMWHENILTAIAEQSQAGTTLATFTAAGDVRRGLISAGFSVTKRKGFGRKREMLCGIKNKTPNTKQFLTDTPWFAQTKNFHPVKNAVVIGAGIAGAQLAFHLAEQGVAVTVVEAADQISAKASGNPAGLLAPKITAKPSDGEAFYIAAFLYQLRQIQCLQSSGHSIDFDATGLLQIAHNEANIKRFETLSKRSDLPSDIMQIMDSKQATDQLQEPPTERCLKIATAGTLFPKSLCLALLDHPNITLKLGNEVTSIKSVDGQQQITFSNGERLSTHAAIIATGHKADKLTSAIELTPVRGQSSTAKLSADYPIKSSLGHKGYVVRDPNSPDQLCFGATYHHNKESEALSDHDTISNLKTLQTYFPVLASKLSHIKNSHAGIRATTRDRWPIVGPIPNEKFYQREYSDIIQGKHYKAYPSARYIEGVYVFSGLGSRGLTSTAYCANILTHIIMGTAPPAPRRFLNALHPARFIVQKLRTKKL